MFKHHETKESFCVSYFVARQSAARQYVCRDVILVSERQEETDEDRPKKKSGRKENYVHFLFRGFFFLLIRY
jgi:hypothetical protein